MEKLTVYSYDVWGNAKDGYDVNELYKFGTFELAWNDIDLDDNKSVLRFLKNIGFIKKSVKLKSLAFDGDPDFTIFVSDAKDGQPICEIRNERK